jgi:cation/acetate symporter
VYTVANVKQARMSIFYATCLIGAFHLMVLVIGYGAMVLVGPEVVKAAGGGGNMAAPLLAMAVGGNAFFGFISAVAFATMLAVVAGLTLSGAAALSHDLWVNVVRNGHASEREQLRVAKIASIVIGGVAIVLGIVFRGQNVAFTAGLAFSIACSANFPVLILSMFWRRYTTAGAVSSLLVGTIVCLVLIYCSPTVQIDVLGRTLAELSGQWWFFPMKNPALVTMPLAIAAGVLVSIFRPEPAAERLFPEMLQRILLGDETASPGRAALPLE